MTESIGTAALYLTVNTEEMVTGVGKAKTAIAGLSADAQKQFQAMSTAQQDVAKNAVRFGENIGKSRSEIRALAAEQRIGGALGREIAASIRAQETALKSVGAATAGATKEMNHYGVSAKQTAAALRGVPAQITDIFTALQGGQRPLTVLIQQGGQLKDMFGGIVPAAKALGSSLLGLINPYTVAAAAAGGLFVAWKQGSDETVKFNQALALTGGIVATTSAQMQGLSLSLAQGVGTQHEAAEALAEVTKTGKFTAAQLREVAAAAIAMEHATGKAVAETVAELAKLGDDPVKAVVALNEQYHFLTEATYQQIKALQEQGRVEEASTLAIQTASRELKKRATDVIEQAGLMERSWLSLKAIVVGTWDAIRDVGRDSNAITQAQMRIASAQSQLLTNAKLLRENGATFSPAMITGFRRDTERLKKQIADAQSVIKGDPATKDAAKKAAHQRTQDLLIAQDQELAALGTAEEKRAKRIARAHADANALIAKARETDDQALIDQVTKQARANEAKIVKAIEAEEKAKKPKAASGVGNATARAALQGFKDDLAQQKSALENAKTLVEERFKSGLVSIGGYYEELRRIAEDTGQVQLDSIQKQIASIQARKVAGKDQVNAAREVATLEAKAAQVREDTSTKLQVLELKEKRAIDDKTEAVKAYVQALQLSNDALRAEMEARVTSIGMGRREYEVQSQTNDVLREKADRLRELALQLQKGQRGESGGISKDQYDADIEAVERWAKDRTRIINDAFAAEDKARADWKNGVLSAVKDIQTETADVAGQTYNIFRNAFDGLSDVLTDFLTTGKSNWKDYFNDLGRQITQFIVNQQLTKWMTGISNMDASSNSGGQTGQIVAGLFDAFAGSGWGGIAKGGAFGGGQKIEAYAMGGVFDQTTPFRHGTKLGVLGEAGPEAIMPLHRGPDGKLGVRMEGAAQALGDTVVNTTFVLPDRWTPQTQAQVAQGQQRVASRATNRNR